MSVTNQSLVVLFSTGSTATPCTPLRYNMTKVLLGELHHYKLVKASPKFRHPIIKRYNQILSITFQHMHFKDLFQFMKFAILRSSASCTEQLPHYPCEETENSTSTKNA